MSEITFTTHITPADRLAADGIVAKIWIDYEARKGQEPSPSELARWSRVYALAAVGLNAKAGRIDTVTEPAAEEPATVKPRKAKPAKGQAKRKATPAKPVKEPERPRDHGRLAGRRVLVPAEQLALLDASPSSSGRSDRA